MALLRRVLGLPLQADQGCRCEEEDAGRWVDMVPVLDGVRLGRDLCVYRHVVAADATEDGS